MAIIEVQRKIRKKKYIHTYVSELRVIARVILAEVSGTRIRIEFIIHSSESLPRAAAPSLTELALSFLARQSINQGECARVVRAKNVKLFAYTAAYNGTCTCMGACAHLSRDKSTHRERNDLLMAVFASGRHGNRNCSCSRRFAIVFVQSRLRPPRRNEQLGQMRRHVPDSIAVFRAYFARRWMKRSAKQERASSAGRLVDSYLTKERTCDLRELNPVAGF